MKVFADVITRLRLGQYLDLGLAEAVRNLKEMTAAIEDLESCGAMFSARRYRST